jgi:hypothetical protein
MKNIAYYSRVDYDFGMCMLMYIGELRFFNIVCIITIFLVLDGVLMNGS